MTSRERVIAAVEFGSPDRIPFIHCCLPASYRAFENLGALYEKYPSDIVGDGNTGLDNPLYKKGEWLDEWQCRWSVLHDGILGQVTGHPLAGDGALKRYRFPDASSADISEDIAAAAAKGEKYARVGWITLFEQMINLRGFETAMMDIIDETPVFLELKERLLSYNLAMIDRLAASNADCIAFADDWGTQLNLLIDPCLWRRHFLPAYSEMFARAKSFGKHVFFHSDGYTMPILGQLIDAGANIFWVDMTVNPMEELARNFAGRVCFQGLTDVQFLLLNGSPESVRAYAKKLMYLFGGANGGFIACSEVDPDQPWENVVAITEAFNEEGGYPLQP